MLYLPLDFHLELYISYKLAAVLQVILVGEQYNLYLYVYQINTSTGNTKALINMDQSIVFDLTFLSID